jgi:streptogramin lyase
VRVDPARAVRVFPLPADADYANLNARSTRRRLVYRSGGYYGRLVPRPAR